MALFDVREVDSAYGGIERLASPPDSIHKIWSPGENLALSNLCLAARLLSRTRVPRPTITDSPAVRFAKPPARCPARVLTADAELFRPAYRSPQFADPSSAKSRSSRIRNRGACLWLFFRGRLIVLPWPTILLLPIVERTQSACRLQGQKCGAAEVRCRVKPHSFLRPERRKSLAYLCKMEPCRRSASGCGPITMPFFCRAGAAGTRKFGRKTTRSSAPRSPQSVRLRIAVCRPAESVCIWAD